MGRSVGVLLGIAFLASCVAAEAQVCRGAADLTAAAAVAGGATIGMSDNSTTVQGVIAGGSSYLAEGRVGVLQIDEALSSATILTTSLLVGGQLPFTASRRVMTCPLGSVRFEYAGDIDGFEGTLWALGGGAAVGGILYDSDAIQIVEAVTLLFERERLKFSNEIGSITTRESIANVKIVTGIVFSRRFTLQTAAHLTRDAGTWYRGFSLSFIARAR